MMKSLHTYLLLLITTCLSGQSIDKNVVASAGQPMKGSNATINFTIGEPLVGLVANNESVDQGFWASSDILVIPLTVGEEAIDIVVYPNPVVEELTVFAGEHKVFGMELFAVNAQRVWQRKVEGSQPSHQIDMSYLTKGVYILQLYMEGNTEIQEYKIIKN